MQTCQMVVTPFPGWRGQASKRWNFVVCEPGSIWKAARKIPEKYLMISGKQTAETNRSWAGSAGWLPAIRMVQFERGAGCLIRGNVRYGCWIVRCSGLPFAWARPSGVSQAVVTGGIDLVTRRLD